MYVHTCLPVQSLSVPAQMAMDCGLDGSPVSISLRYLPKVQTVPNKILEKNSFNVFLLDHAFHLSFQPEDAFPLSHTIQLMQRLHEEAESLDEEEAFVGKVYYFDDLPACLVHSALDHFFPPHSSKVSYLCVVDLGISGR